jgi:hypothetical protein
LQSSYCARSLRCAAGSSICRPHRSAASQSKDSNADTRGCTQNTQMATGPRLCLLPNVGNPRRTIKRVAHGVSAAPDHLRALRASAYICVESFLVPRRHRSRDAGRDHQRSQPVAASSVAALIFAGNDSVARSSKSTPCRCLAEASSQAARIFAVSSTEFHEVHTEIHRVDSYWRCAPD